MFRGSYVTPPTEIRGGEFNIYDVTKGRFPLCWNNIETQGNLVSSLTKKSAILSGLLFSYAKEIRINVQVSAHLS